MAYFIIIAAIVLSGLKFYKNRALFQSLSKLEWLRYIAVFLFACFVAIVIIVGGAKSVQDLHLGWFNHFIKIIIILIGMACARAIMSKMLPAKLKSFYS